MVAVSDIQNPAETIEMRDALADWIEGHIVYEANFEKVANPDKTYTRFADDLIRSGWVTMAPEAAVKL